MELRCEASWLIDVALNGLALANSDGGISDAGLRALRRRRLHAGATGPQHGRRGIRKPVRRTDGAASRRPEQSIWLRARSEMWPAADIREEKAELALAQPQVLMARPTGFERADAMSTRIPIESTDIGLASVGARSE
jgi:hypothetical protein